jgi:hypothetical protein
VTAEPAIRGSRILAALDEILHDGQSSWQIVELAGRGISAQARCTIAVVESKNRDLGSLPDDWVADKLAAADNLVEAVELEDELVDLWRRRCAGEAEAAEFEAGLRDIVQRSEVWPAHLMRKSGER